MAATSDAWVQLATHIPRNLHRDVKLHCLQGDVTLMAFVVAAIEEKLRPGRQLRRGREHRSPR